MADALYIHVPFCIKKCGYCDFFSVKYDDKLENGYVGAVIKEIEHYGIRKFDTIYFGGGTPSLLSPEKISGILQKAEYFENSEITLEVNPGTVDYQKLTDLKKAGINRLSIGIQTFDDDMLKKIGRIHSAKTAFDAYGFARQAGFENISIDLMFALPGQTMNGLAADLKMIGELRPEHVSIYSLIWEEGTPLFDSLQKGGMDMCAEETEAEMYVYIIAKMKEMGYIHYEVSNFSLKGCESRHNSKYWMNKEYVGVGAGASGYINNIRYKNIEDIEKYINAVENEKRPYCESEEINNKQKLEYHIILGLRLLEIGVDIKKTALKLGIEPKPYLETADNLIDKGLLYNKNGAYCLTDKGLMIANSVFEKFI